MKLEEIQIEWETDSNIDISDLRGESVRTLTLHSKYHNILNSEKIRQYTLEEQMASHIQNISKDVSDDDVIPDFDTIRVNYQIEKIKLRKRQKDEVKDDIENDPTIREMRFKIFLQKEKVKFIESILKLINNRTFIIKNIIDENKFQNGG